MKNEKINKKNTTKSFFDLLDKLDEQEWNLNITSDWTIKDCIAHMIGWEKEVTKTLPKCWKTKKDPWFMKNDDNYREFNKKLVDEYKDWNYKDLIIEWKKWQKLLDKEIEKIGESKIRDDGKFADWVFDEGDSHYLEHLEQIKKALKKV